MTTLTDKISILLANTYALCLKTQNYHWHVRGAHFKMIHEQLEDQYKELIEAVDLIAERIVILGQKAPATFKKFEALKTIEDGNSDLKASEMLTELRDDHQTVIKTIHQILKLSGEESDEGTAALLSERLVHHEKTRWMLDASISE